MKAPALGWQLLATFVLSLAVLIGLIGWLQNVNIITGNGLYKAMQAEPWIADFRHGRLDASNYLYFPLYGALAQLLDWVGVLRGIPYKQFAYLNAFFASLGCVFVYAFVRRLTGSAVVAIAATLFHFGTGFFLLLGVISEDIMPGYVLILAYGGAVVRPAHLAADRHRGRRVHTWLDGRVAADVSDASGTRPGAAALRRHLEDPGPARRWTARGSRRHRGDHPADMGGT